MHKCISLHILDDEQHPISLHPSPPIPPFPPPTSPTQPNLDLTIAMLITYGLFLSFSNPFGKRLAHLKLPICIKFTSICILFLSLEFNILDLTTLNLQIVSLFLSLACHTDLCQKLHFHKSIEKCWRFASFISVIVSEKNWEILCCSKEGGMQGGSLKIFFVI